MGFTYKTRIVSQDGMTTIPYDQFTLTLNQNTFDGKFYISAVPVTLAWHSYAEIIGKSITLGVYRSDKIAKQVFERILYMANERGIVDVLTEDEATKLYSEVEEDEKYGGGFKPSVRYDGTIHTEAFD